MLSLVRMFRVSVWHNHFRKGESVKDWADITLVVEGDVIEDYTLFVIEANMEVPFLPVDGPAIDFERNTFWLSDVDGFDVVPVTTLLLDSLCMIVAWWSFANHPPYRRDVYVDNLLRFRVVDRAEVQWEGILAVIRVGSIVHQPLLQADTGSKTLIVTDCPSYGAPIRCCFVISQL